MIKRILPFVLLLASSGVAHAQVAFPIEFPGEVDGALRKRALAIHRRALVVDTHNDVTSAILDDKFDMGGRATKGHTDIPRLREGGVGGAFLAIYVAPSYAERGGLKRMLEMIDGVYRQVRRHHRDLELATRVADIRRIRRQGRIAVLMGIEGGHAIEDSLAAISMPYELAAR